MTLRFVLLARSDFVTLNEDAGHNIIAHEAFDSLEVDPAGLDVLDSADLVIFSRDTNSGDYNDPAEQEYWTEGVTVPMIILTPFVIRDSRWDMAPSNAILETDKVAGFGPLLALQPEHPVFAGVLDANNEADVFDEDALGSDDDPYSWGEKNTKPAGDQILLNAINWMTGGGVLTGDFDHSGALDAAGIDDLTARSAASMHPPAYDLNGDSLVDDGDIGVWVGDLFGSWIGDANLDGEFNSSDLVVVLSSGTYEAEVDAVWSTGDFNGDGRANSSDLVAALSDGGYEQGPKTAVAAVPEPATPALLLIGTGLIVGRRRR